MEFLRSILGVIVIIGLAYLISRDKRHIQWKLVGSGVLIQVLLALLIFKVPFVHLVFESVASFFTQLLKFTDKGAEFVFGKWPTVAELFSVQFKDGEIIKRENYVIGYIFAFKVLPTIVFFSALTSLLYYLGVLQRIVYVFAWLMKKTMRLSGAESLSAAANIFIGQTEAPLVVKPYIDKMSRSEIMCLMTGGMATIAGGVFAAFIELLGGDSLMAQQEFATHLLTASILSAPAAIVISKILIPETGEIDERLHINQEKMGANPLDAISNGTTEGVKLAVNVGAMLLVFTAMVAMVNYIFSNIIGAGLGINPWIEQASGGTFTSLSLEVIFGFVFAPVAWIIGISPDDILQAGRLIGEKTVLNEFYAYTSMSELIKSGVFVNERSVFIMTYALCGFSNIASIGIQIGGIGTIAPNQRTTLSKLGIMALIGGTFACLMTATIAGMFI